MLVMGDDDDELKQFWDKISPQVLSVFNSKQFLLCNDFLKNCMYPDSYGNCMAHGIMVFIVKLIYNCALFCRPHVVGANKFSCFK